MPARVLTDWQTYQRDRAHSGFVDLNLKETSFKVQWAFPTYGVRNGAVTVEGPRVTFASGRSLRCVDTLSGKPYWERDFSSHESLGDPAISGGRVYVQTAGHANSFVWSLDAKNGETLFQSSYGNQADTYLAPTVDDGGVYVGGGYYGGMYAFDASTGAERWHVDLAQNNRFTPTVTDARVFAFVGGLSPLTGVNKRSGAIEVRVADGGFQGIGALDRALVSDGPDHSVGIDGGRLLRFDHTRQAIEWAVSEGFVGQPAVAGGQVFAVNRNVLEARDVNTGGLLWRWAAPAEESLNGTVVLTESHVFLRATKAPTLSRRVLAVSRDTRTDVWTRADEGPLAIAQGKLFIATDSSIVAVDLLGDADGDGLSDSWELSYGGDFDPGADQDGDGLSNLQEQEHATLPLGWDSDGDGRPDGKEVAYGSDPIDADTDLDTLSDGDEVYVHGTDPRAFDSDSDGVDDAVEVELGMDPLQPADASQDRDGDGYSNRHEALAGTDPNSASASPRLDDWAMFQGNARHDGYQPALLDASQFRVRWSQAVPSASVLNGGAYVATGGQQVFRTGGREVAALDMASGALRWAFAIPPASGGTPGTVSPPSFAAGSVYVHVSEQSTRIIALDAVTGALRFNATHQGALQSFIQPTILGTRLYTSTGFRMAELDASGGDWGWDVPLSSLFALEPALDADHLYAFDGSAMIERDRATGAQQRSLPIAVGNTSPVLGRRRNVLVGGGTSLMNLDLSAGKIGWATLDVLPSSFGNPPPAGKPFYLANFEQPAVGNGCIYVLRDGRLEVYHEKTGRRLWIAATSIYLSSNLVVSASHIFVGNATDTYAIDLRTRSVVFTHPLGGALALSSDGALVISGAQRVDVLDLKR